MAYNEGEGWQEFKVVSVSALCSVNHQSPCVKYYFSAMKFVGKTFHVLLQTTGSELKYTVETLLQHDGSSSVFSFRAKRSITQNDDLMYFVYETARGRSPISSSYDKDQLPLDYYVIGTNSSTRCFYVQSGNHTKFAKISVEDPKLNNICSLSLENTMVFQVYDLVLEGKTAYCGWTHFCAFHFSRRLLNFKCGLGVGVCRGQNRGWE